MRKLRSVDPIFAALAALLTGCGGTLARSARDQAFRAQGTYICAPRALRLSHRVKATSTVVRCYRDTVRVEGGKLEWVRAFHEDSECQSRVLGRGRWSAHGTWSAQGDRARFVASRPVTQVTLSRLESDWIMEPGGRCDLRRRVSGEVFVIDRAGACAGLFDFLNKPALDLQTSAVDAHEAADALVNGDRRCPRFIDV